MFDGAARTDPANPPPALEPCRRLLGNGGGSLRCKSGPSFVFPDGSSAELCIDLGEIRTARDGETRRALISEIEIELKEGNASNLFGLARRLAEDLPVAVLTKSKAERGYALLHDERDMIGAPVRANGVPVAANQRSHCGQDGLAHHRPTPPLAYRPSPAL